MVVAAKRLFICYARVDAAAVQAVAAECTQLGQDVWFDQQLSGGQQWWDTILENIRGCDCFIFALSPSSLHSKACRAELAYAHGLQRRILPVVVGEAVPDQLLPPYVAQTQRVDPSQPHQLARALLSIEPAPPFNGPAPPPPPVPISYLDELAGAVERRDLSLPEQRNLVGELKDRLAQEDEWEGARALLLRLRQRSDVYNSVAAEIDELLTTLPPPRTSGPARPFGAPPEAPLVAPPPRKHKGRVAVGIGAALLVIGGVGAGGYVVANRDDPSTADDNILPAVTDPPAPTDAPVVTPTPQITDPPVVTEAPIVSAAPLVTDPPPTAEPDIPLTLDEKFPGVDFSQCDALTTSPGRAVPIQAAQCYFAQGTIVVEFYNFGFEELESEVAYWTQYAWYSDAWENGDGVPRGRVLEVTLDTGGDGIYWTYDDDAYSAFAYGDPTASVPFEDLRSFWESFDLHTV